MNDNNNLPTYPPDWRPKLRRVRLENRKYSGQPMLYIIDPQRIASNFGLMVSVFAGYALMAADGTHTLPEIQTFVKAEGGLELPLTELQKLFAELDKNAMLENAHYRALKQTVVDEYRSAPFRQPSSAGAVYPDNEAKLLELLDGYFREAGDVPEAPNVRGVISPHIDFARGGQVYARTWKAVASAAQSADMVVVVGTDHQGGAPFTLTRQDYATPFGVLQTDQAVVADLAAIIGEDAAFQDELHHRNEHSLELVLVWLHYIRRENPPTVVPVLTGSLHQSDQTNVSGTVQEVVEYLRNLATRNKVLLLASGDLAHVGPAFNTPEISNEAGLLALKQHDSDMLEPVVDGDATAFLNFIERENDDHNVCGVSPFYIMLQALQETEGQLLAYGQAVADDNNTSWVSIAGAAFG